MTYKRDDEIERGREVSGGEEERHPNGDRSGKKASDLPHLLHGDGAIDRSISRSLWSMFECNRLRAPALRPASLRQRDFEFESTMHKTNSKGPLHTRD